MGMMLFLWFLVITIGMLVVNFPVDGFIRPQIQRSKREASSTTGECQSSLCGRYGMCVDKTGKCLCSLGHTGTYCNQVFSHPSVTEYASVNLQGDSTIVCEQGSNNCQFFVYVMLQHGNVTFPGLVSEPSVKMNAIPVAFSSSVGDDHLAGVLVSDFDTSTVGETDICFTLKETIPEEVCYKIEITSSSGLPLETFFQPFNIPAGSTLYCDSYCHFLVLTQIPLLPTDDCDQVKINDTYWSWYFPTVKNAPVNCVTEIIYSPGPGERQLCLYVESTDESLCYNIANGTIAITTEPDNRQSAVSILPLAVGIPLGVFCSVVVAVMLAFCCRPKRDNKVTVVKAKKNIWK